MAHLRPPSPTNPNFLDTPAPPPGWPAPTSVNDASTIALGPTPEKRSSAPVFPSNAKAERTVCTASRTAKIAAVLFVICVAVLASAAVSVHFPSAAPIFYAVGGTVAGISLTVALLALFRNCTASKASTLQLKN